jgi:hypothetical protein
MGSAYAKQSLVRTVGCLHRTGLLQARVQLDERPIPSQRRLGFKVGLDLHTHHGTRVAEKVLLGCWPVKGVCVLLRGGREDLCAPYCTRLVSSCASQKDM